MGKRLTITGFSVFLVLFGAPLCAQPDTPVAPASETAAPGIALDKVRSDVVGFWLVEVAGEKRTRTLQVRRVDEPIDGTAKLDAVYGFSDERQTAVTALLRLVSAAWTLELTTQAGSRVIAEPGANGVMAGSFTPKGGDARQVKLTRMSREDLRRRLMPKPATTPWPTDLMRWQGPGSSASPVHAMLPTDVSVQPPAADVPPKWARWSGSWSGWACMQQACDTKLAVEQVFSDGATIVYAFASATIEPFSSRLQAIFVDDELQAAFANGARIAYRMRIDGNLDYIWYRGAEWGAGVLSKER